MDVWSGAGRGGRETNGYIVMKKTAIDIPKESGIGPRR